MTDCSAPRLLAYCQHKMDCPKWADPRDGSIGSYKRFKELGCTCGLDELSALVREQEPPPQAKLLAHVDEHLAAKYAHRTRWDDGWHAAYQNVRNAIMELWP